MNKDNQTDKMGGSDKITDMGILIVRISGDITRVDSDAIITAINSSGLWFGGIDGAIQRVAGSIYHGQVAQKFAQGELSDLKVVVARGNHNDHKGKFDNVVFVIDDLKSELSNVIARGLEEADVAGFKKVTIPAIRTGVMLGAVETSLEQVVDEYVKGIRKYIIGKTVDHMQETGIKRITFVTYNNPELEDILYRALFQK